MSSRRSILRTLAATASLGSAGCSGSDEPASNGTRSPAASTGTEPSTMAIPVECGAGAGTRRFPSLPSEVNDESIESFAREFERAYREPELASAEQIESLSTRSVEEVDGGHVVELGVEVDWITDGESTHTEKPTDAGRFSVTYRIGRDRVYREEARVAGGSENEDCWTLSTADDADRTTAGNSATGR